MIPSIPNTFANQSGNVPASELDANFTALATAFGDVIAADGTQGPTSAISWNSQRLTNLAAPQSSTEPVRLLDLFNQVAQAAGNITNYGAVSGSDAGAAIAADSSANSLVTVPSGAWPIASTPTIPVGVILQALPGATFSLTGAATLGFTAGALNQTIEFNTASSDYAVEFFFRNANHTGGTPGNVSSCVNVRTNVSAGVTNFEWAHLAVLNNSATAGENVAAYAQGNRQTSSTGPTWAAVSEVIDHGGVANPASGLVGHEVDVRASGTDTSFNRVGVDIVCTRFPIASGTAVHVGFGCRIQAGGDGANVTVDNGFSVFSVNTAVAFDCGNATSVTTGALRMPSGVPILFDVVGTNQMAFTSGFASVGGLTYKVGSNLVAGLGSDGGLYFGTGAGAFAAWKGTTYTSATAGSNGALPLQVAGYIQLILTGSTVKVPYYNA